MESKAKQSKRICREDGLPHWPGLRFLRAIRFALKLLSMIMWCAYIFYTKR